MDIIDASVICSGLWDAAADGSGGKRVGFKAVFEDLGLPDAPVGVYSTDCSSWVGVAGVMYGSQPLDGFVFDVDADGRVLAVENSALRRRLVKVS